MAQEKWLVSEPMTIEIDQIDRLKIGLVGGSVDVVVHDEPGARIEITSVKGKELRVEYDGSTLEIDHPQLRWDNWLDVFRGFRGRDTAELSVAIPRSAAVKLGVVNADALVSGVEAEVSASAVTGELVIDGCTGRLFLNTVGGELSVRDHTGAIHANSVSGDLTASGAISDLKSDGVSGSVLLDATGVPDRMRINTVSGSVTLRLEPEVAARYTVNTVSGRLRFDDTTVQGVIGRFSTTFGTLERHWLDFSASTVSGDVNVVHAVRA